VGSLEDEVDCILENLPFIKQFESGDDISQQKSVIKRWGKEDDRIAFKAFVDKIVQEGYTIKSYFNEVSVNYSFNP
jgi:hypothetical protein